MVFLRLLSIAAIAAYASTCAADVLSSNPVAGTSWVIGRPAEIRWRLSSPTAKNDTATIFLVGGDHTAYTRLETLATSVVLGTHKLIIPKVPNISCGDSCALEFWLDGEGRVGDFYSHSFAISVTGVVTISATSGIIADKSAPGKTYALALLKAENLDCDANVSILLVSVFAFSAPASGGMNPNGATPNGPISLVQNAAKGAQSTNQTSAAKLDTPALVATIAASLVVSALSMTWVL
ncbi:hypothetical protein BGZ82_005209 [Podila clonocystis]|nr:hypothetical protein BGZ82_005209 [Podila clonocystis]